MHQITLFQDKKSKNCLGKGLPHPTPLGASFKAEGRLGVLVGSC